MLYALSRCRRPKIYLFRYYFVLIPLSHGSKVSIYVIYYFVQSDCVLYIIYTIMRDRMFLTVMNSS